MGLIQTSGKKLTDGSGTSITYNASANFQKGNSVVLKIAHYGPSGGRISAITASGTAAVKQYERTAATDNNYECWLAQNIAGGSSAVVLTVPTGSYVVCSFEERDDIAQAGFNQSGTAGPTTSSAPTVSTTGPTLQATDLVYALFGDVVGTNWTSATPPTGWTETFEEPDGTAHEASAAAYRERAPAGTQTAVFGTGASMTWVAIIATFKMRLATASNAEQVDSRRNRPGRGPYSRGRYYRPVGETAAPAATAPPATGALAATQGACVAALVGGVEVAGALAATQGLTAAGLSGGVQASGVLASTQAGNAAALAGGVAISGTLAPAQTGGIASISVSSFLYPRFSTLAGSWSPELRTRDFVFEADPVIGSLASTQGANAGALVAAVAVSGSAAATQGANSASLVAAVAASGALAGAQAQNAAAASGAVVISGALAATQAANAASAAGAVAVSGALAATQAPNAASIAGYTAPWRISSLAVQWSPELRTRLFVALDALTTVEGALAATQGANTASAIGAVAISGSIAATQGVTSSSIDASNGAKPRISALVGQWGAEQRTRSFVVLATQSSITGTIAATQGANTAAAQAAAGISGALAVTQGKNVLSTGFVPWRVTPLAGRWAPDLRTRTFVALDANTSALTAVQGKNVASIAATTFGGSNQFSSYALVWTPAQRAREIVLDGDGRTAVLAGLQSKNAAAISAAVAVSGALAGAQGKGSANIVSALAITGTLASVQAAGLAALSGAAVAAGTLAGAQSAGTLSAAAGVAVSGALAGAQSKGSMAGAGALAISGTLAASQGAGTAVITAALDDARWGEIAGAQGATVAGATAAVLVDGALAATQGATTAAIVVDLPITYATLAAQQQRTSATITAADPISGALASTQGKTTVALAGDSPGISALVGAQGKCALAASGDVQVSGALAVVQAGNIVVAGGAAAIAGELAAAQGRAICSVVASLGVAGVPELTLNSPITISVSLRSEIAAALTLMSKITPTVTLRSYLLPGSGLGSLQPHDAGEGAIAGLQARNGASLVGVVSNTNADLAATQGKNVAAIAAVRAFNETYPNGLADYSLFYDTFGSGMTYFSVVSSPYGTALRGAEGNESGIKRDMGVSLHLNKVSFYVYTGTTRPDDAMSLGLNDPTNSTVVFGFVPKRQDTADSQRRMLLVVSPYPSFLFGPALDDNTWYYVEVTFADGTNACHVDVKRADTLAAHASASFTQQTGGYTAKYLWHGLEGSVSNHGCETEYAQITVS